MQNQVDIKPTKLSSILVSVFVIIDGFSVLTCGLINLLINTINADVARSTLNISKAAAWLACAYFIICFVSLIYWLIGKVVWRYVILVLGLIPFAISSHFLIYSGFLKYLFYGLLAINMLLIAFIVFDIVKSKSIIHR